METRFNPIRAYLESTSSQDDLTPGASITVHT